MRYTQLTRNKYLEIEYLAKKLLKIKFKSIFDTQNIFYLKDEKKEMCAVFIDNYGYDCYGLSVYEGIEGMNSIHDMLMVKNEDTLSLTDDASICLMFCKKKDLAPDEIKFLNKHAIKIKRENNVIIRSNKRGVVSYISTTREAIILRDALIYLLALLNQELEQIKDAFSQNKQVLAYFSSRKKEYNIIFGDLPYLEREHPYSEINIEYVNEFKDYNLTNDKAMLLFKNMPTPVKTEKSNVPVMPLFITYSISEKSIIGLHATADNSEDYSSFTLNILQDAFKTHGIAKEMIINNRQMYYDLRKTLEQLGITVYLQIENPKMDSVLKTLSMMTTKFFEIILMENNKNYIYEKEFNQVFQNISSMADQDHFIEDYELVDTDLEDYEEDEERYLNIEENEEEFIS